MLNIIKDILYARMPERIKGYLRSDIRESFMEHLLGEGENPMTIMNHVEAILEAGFAGVTVEYRFALFGIISAQKSDLAED